MQKNLFTAVIWATWSFSGIFILGYSIYIENHLLIVTSGLNLGLNCTILALKSWQSSINDCLLSQIEDYDTEFDYTPGYDYESNNPFSCRGGIRNL